TTTDYADFFRNHFSSIKDLIPGSQSDLLTNVNRVKDLLTAVNSQKGVGREDEGRFNQNKSA
ncbi:unnamed protein product, partial [Mesorhabditis spiculigera]